MKLKSPTNKSAGFSLIELLVAVTIIIIITSVALFNQAKFSSDILISNAAYEVALTIRQAQVYGISSKGGPDVNLNQYRSGYGVHFDAANPETFMLFLDTPDGTYSASNEDTAFNFFFDPTDIVISPFIGFTQGQTFHRFCAHDTAVSLPGGWRCWRNDGLLSLDIVFVKPNPDAHIVIGETSGHTGSCIAEGHGPNCNNLAKVYDQAIIVIQSGLGDKCRTVRVFSTGQISVDSPTASGATASCDVSG